MVDVVNDITTNNPVVIFSKVTCPYSVKSKKLITTLGFKFMAIELDERADRAELEEALNQVTGLDSTPYIFIGGRCIGNNKDIQLMGQQDLLVPALQDANAYEHGKLQQ